MCEKINEDEGIELLDEDFDEDFLDDMYISGIYSDYVFDDPERREFEETRKLMLDY